VTQFLAMSKFCEKRWKNAKRDLDKQLFLNLKTTIFAHS